ncbi:flagellar protein export ATPase FliI [Rhodomicrobium vannielii ATCC 17100]|uniref:FliI/YscN family ATPase n=1 Tax=Rhodomicrobium vannielii TaxID=1069 RepID=UPI001918C1EA|nr:FliI/YscN family ATPase [Rhodomicrobium vannielii]MBJ7535914.1 flagellar protein export ATPase FliI [Rhodomicrobium vannielii ATCC 17100]
MTAEQPHRASSGVQPRFGRTALEILAETFEAALDDRLAIVSGRVVELSTEHIRVEGLSKFTKLGDWVSIATDVGDAIAETLRVERDTILVRTIEERHQPFLGAPVRLASTLKLRPDETWKGRVIDALGRHIDNGPPLAHGRRFIPVDQAPPLALERQRVSEPVPTGVRVIDVFTPLCAGQRIGIFAGSGVGKSTLLSMLTRGSSFDVTVFAAIGERGREVREFIDDTLAKDGLAKAVLVVSTSDESPMMRRLAAKTAFAVAEYFRDEGQRVLLVFDSVTRYAHAVREIALSSGEPPVSRGYPPSVFTDLPKLLERAGNSSGTGSITGVFSVLVDGDDHNDPVADTLRGILDGHIVLDRAIADQGRFPAVDILGSVSRLAPRVWSPSQKSAVRDLKGLISRFEETRDIRMIAGHKPNNDAELDKAVRLVPALYRYLTQSAEDLHPGETLDDMLRLMLRAS